MAANGRWGWVPEVCFTGGADDEDDAGLLMPGSITCVRPCGNLYPMPPWRVRHGCCLSLVEWPRLSR